MNLTPEQLRELLGYIGSALTIISMLMTSVVKLRVIGTVGNAVGLVYTLMIGSYPVAIMNVFLIIINIYNLTKLFRPTKHFELISLELDDTFLRYFLRHWKDDLKLHFPEFDRKAVQANRAFLVCCNSMPAGVVLGKEVEAGVLDIALDYSTPHFRDCSVAKFFHTQLPESGIHTLLSSQSMTKQHVAYLKKMNFSEKNGIYVKKLRG